MIASQAQSDSACFETTTGYRGTRQAEEADHSFGSLSSWEHKAGKFQIRVDCK